MRQIFDSVTDVSLWLASQGFFVTLLLVLIPYALLSVHFTIKGNKTETKCESGKI